MRLTLRLFWWMAAVLIASPVALAHAANGSAPTRINAKAAFLIDSQTGETLWEHNADLPLPPASTTKVMTALLALQSGRLEESFAVSRGAAAEPPSKISLRPGWRMRLNDLVYAILLSSANDASVVIAEGLAGSVPEFASRMNAKARMLGARNTHFVNPNGLPDDDHYSSARDLATVFRYAMHTPLFAEIVSTRVGQVSPTYGSRRRIALRNHNRLLGNYRIQVVGKTGWTRAARKCFVGAASAGGKQLTFAILGSNDIWGDIKRLLEFGFGEADRPQPDPDELLMASVTDGESRAGGDRVEPSRRIGSPTYSVRLGTFRSLSSAKQVKRSAARKGYPARIEKLGPRRGSLYRVAVGQYDDRREAQRAAEDLKRAQRNLSALIVSNR
jgi:D-alanyl-D-alanine carboxypeptidase (penicillin-binding protein 5/6)